MLYKIKCDECKKEIGETDSQAMSAAGGICRVCQMFAMVAARELRMFRAEIR